MKRKVYTTRREQMTDQILGFLAFPLVNLPLGIMLAAIRHRTDSSLLMLLAVLPWLVNGSILVLAVLLRPAFAVGYIVFIGAVLVSVIALSVVVVAACFVTIPLFLVIGDLGNWVFITLVLIGLYLLVVWAIDLFKNWWSSDKGNSE
jgi:hypothetical protein